MRSRSRTSATLSPRERDIIRLAWDGKEDFEEFAAREWEAHKEEIRAVSASFVRWTPTPPGADDTEEDIANRKLFRITRYSEGQVLKATRGYMGKPYEENSKTGGAYRMWHVVRHGSKPITHSNFTVQWWLEGDAHGINEHFHSLIIFRVPITKAKVEQITQAKASPMHTSINRAIEYVRNQSVSVRMSSPAPRVIIHRSDRDKPDSLIDAASAGEPPDLLSKTNTKNLINYYRTFLRDNPSINDPVFFPDSRKAEIAAWQVASGSHTSALVIDYHGSLANYVNTPPPGFFSQSVVCLVNVREEYIPEIRSREGWLVYPDIIFFSASTTYERDGKRFYTQLTQEPELEESEFVFSSSSSSPIHTPQSVESESESNDWLD